MVFKISISLCVIQSSENKNLYHNPIPNDKFHILTPVEFVKLLSS